jgi:hypothetical protein
MQIKRNICNYKGATIWKSGVGGMDFFLMVKIEKKKLFDPEQKSMPPPNFQMVAP